MSEGDIPGFTLDSEMEKLLENDLFELDRETRMDVQLYKSRKMQALRDAGLSADQIESSLGRIEHQYGGIQNGSEPEPSPSGQEPADSTGERESFEFSSGGDEHPRVDFYRQFKSRLGEADSDAKEAESVEPRETRSEERTPSERSPEAPEAPPLPVEGLTERLFRRIRELEARVSEYQERILGLQEQIGDLRERNARLEERSRS